MRDKRPVDELSIEELERVLAIRKREERQKQIDRMRRSGRVIADVPDQTPAAAAPPATTLPAATVNLPQSAVKTTPRFEDDPGEVLVRRGSDAMWKAFVNRALLFVEVCAVIGLVFLGVTLFQAMSKLQEETASAQSAADEIRRAGIPTIEPTPQLRIEQVVLPGGHKPPSEGGQFNFDEIPAHLLPAVQNQILQPVLSRPPQTDQTPLTLLIPKLNIDQSIIQGVDWTALSQGVGQVQNGVTPADEVGNLVFAAHNDIYSEIFRDLDQLQPGDQFQVLTATRAYTYVVVGTQIVNPTDVHVMDNRRGPTVTLISCYPYQVNNKRIVVFANRVDI